MRISSEKTITPAAGHNRRAVALVLTLVVLVVLTSVVYTLVSRLSRIKHRRQYIIDYQTSRYACDSAVKYALDSVGQMSFNLIKRADKPDFSDVFTMNSQQYAQLLQEWAEQRAAEEALDLSGETISSESLANMQDIVSALSDMPIDGLLGDLTNLLSESSAATDDPNFIIADYTEPNELVVPGPYGPEWPYVYKPIKLQIGNTNITIEITDENAKMPLTWAIISDKKVKTLAKNAFEVFCEWMQMDFAQIDSLAEQLKDVEDIKRFTINPKPITITKRLSAQTRRSTRRSRRTRTRTVKETLHSTLDHSTDFAKLLHGPFIDLQALAAPLPDTGDRYESPLKYLSMWGSQKVNINTAPRHVLEAALTFGGDAEDIAEEIIQRRREKPFKNIAELEKSLYRYTESIKKAKPYITTTSTFFTIKVTAVHGRARTCAVATVAKSGKSLKPVAVISCL